MANIETEVKIRIDDPADLCRRLENLNSTCISTRHFEDNHLLDFGNESLQTHKCTLRIRLAGGRGVLTYKGAPRPDGIFKTREELETDLADADIALQIFERMGMKAWFRYQKYRREFEIDGVHVAVDETPIGNYVELEGTKETIRSLAQRLGFEESQFVSLSYHSLYLAYCRNNGIVPHFMIFKNAELSE
jgi:adenylate cyclase, class 2